MTRVPSAVAAAPPASRAGGRSATGRRADADPLSPVRAALLGAARRQGDATRAAAAADAEATLAAARRQAAEILSQARARGELDGRSAAAARRTAARRTARSVVLAAQRAAYDELRSAVGTAVGELRTDPVYPRLLDRLEELARGIAGPSAVVSRHPAGGVVARGAGTLVDCSLPRLAERAVGGLGVEVSALWTG